MDTFSLSTRNLTLAGIANTSQGITECHDDVVVALHGWQDNAASFLPLMDALGSKFPVYAFDWPGHGQSQWRSEDAHYYFIDYVDDLMQIVNQVNAKRIHLVGHSMGAMVASLFAASTEREIASMTLLEGIGLVCASAQEAKELLQRALKQRMRVAKVRTYDNPHAIIERRVAVSDFNDHIATTLMSRNIKPVQDGYTLSTDPRIKHYSAFRYDKSQAHALLSDINVPTLFIKGLDGYQLVIDNEILFSKHYNNLEVKSVAGGHHCHMQSPELCARLIGAHLHQNGAI